MKNLYRQKSLKNLLRQKPLAFIEVLGYLLYTGSIVAMLFAPPTVSYHTFALIIAIVLFILNVRRLIKKEYTNTKRSCKFTINSATVWFAAVIAESLVIKYL